MGSTKASRSLDSSEFSETDSLLREAGVDTGQLNIEAVLDQARGGGDIQLPTPPAAASGTTSEQTVVAKAEPAKTNRRKKPEPVQLDNASKEAVASFQRTKDLPSFVTAVRAVRKTVKDLNERELLKTLGIQPYWAKGRLKFFELDIATQELIMEAGHDISALQLQKLLKEGEGGREALLNTFIKPTPERSPSASEKPPHGHTNAEDTESGGSGSLTGPAPAPLAQTIADINARIELVEEAFGNFLNDLIAFSQLPSSILSELIRTKDVSSLRPALQKLSDSIEKD